MNQRKIPEYCFRGIPKFEFLKDTLPLPEAFQFDKVPERGDNYLEASINWEDDDGALEEVFSQLKRDGELQFKAGAVHINMKSVKTFLRPFLETGEFNYERKVTYNDDGTIANPYHGNFLVDAKVSKNHKAMISSGLAFAAEDIYSNPNYQEQK